VGSRRAVTIISRVTAVSRLVVATVNQTPDPGTLEVFDDVAHHVILRSR
jgi:hypothetical protein